mmetsp:Transcript_8276/g.27237  ORF Transcript_8276/g.27237 Transcript_8276/m.27237 type:complete len:252 (+) Transcript_8276:97-852(+)
MGLFRRACLARSTLDDAGADLRLEEDAVDVASDEDDLGDARLAGLPLGLGRAEVDLLVHALEDKLGVALARKRQHALGAVEVGGARLEQLGHEHIELWNIEETLDGDAARGDHGQVVHRAGEVAAEQLGVELRATVDVERGQADELREVDDGPRRVDDHGEAVDGLDRVVDGLELVGGDEVALVQQDAVRKGDLLDGLVDGAVGLDLLQVAPDVLRVGEADDRVDQEVVVDPLVRLERGQDGRRVGEPRGL